MVTQEEYMEEEGVVGEEQEVAPDYELILEEYRRKQMVEHLVGPIISLVLHVVAIIGCIFFITPSDQQVTEEVEITIEEVEIKEIEPELEKKLEELEEFADEVVPTVAIPEIVNEAVDAPSVADFSDDAPQTDNNMDFDAVLDVKVNPTALRISGMYYGGRSNSGRAAANKKFGGGGAGESAIVKALEWLKKTQRPDGAWSRSSPNAMAGLGLLTYLSHGELPDSEEYGLTVTRAMQWVASAATALPDKHQGMGTGRTREDPGSYTHGIVTYALAEAYGMTRLPYLKAPMEKMVFMIIRGQQPHSGGWDYNFAMGARSDLSLSSWMIQAMKAAYIAEADVDGLAETMNKAADYVQKRAFNNNTKRFRYAVGEGGSAGEGGSWGIQGIGALCLQLLGRGTSNEARAAVESIANLHTAQWNDKARYTMHSTPFYDWYYEVQAVFHGGMQSWNKWRPVFQRVLVQNQHQEGYWSIPGPESHRPEYEKWYSTTLACLTMMVHYRNLPSYQEPRFQFKQRVTGPSLDDDPDLGLEIQ